MGQQAVEIECSGLQAWGPSRKRRSKWWKNASCNKSVVKQALKCERTWRSLLEGFKAEIYLRSCGVPLFGTSCLCQCLSSSSSFETDFLIFCRAHEHLEWKLHFPASFAGRYGQVTKFWPMRSKTEVLRETSRTEHSLFSSYLCWLAQIWCLVLSRCPGPWGGTLTMSEQVVLDCLPPTSLH